jgi:hypothetical protein
MKRKYAAANGRQQRKDNKKEKFADIFHENTEKANEMKEVDALQGNPMICLPKMARFQGKYSEKQVLRQVTCHPHRGDASVLVTYNRGGISQCEVPRTPSHQQLVNFPFSSKGAIGTTPHI